MSNIGMPITLLASDVNGDPSQLTWWYLCTENGTPVVTGEAIKDFRGEETTIVDGMPPHKQGSTGRVVTSEGGVFYPGVFGLVWVDQTTVGSAELERGYNQDR